MNQRDFEGDYLSRRSVYEINYQEFHVQDNNEEQIRTRLRNMEYRVIFYNQPLNSQNIPNSTNENRARRRGTLKALSLIFKNWRRGNSIRPQLLNDNCGI